MPHTTSAKKRLRQDEKRRLNNRATTKTVRTQIKKVLAAVKSGSPETAQAEYNLAAKKLDQAAAKGVVHRNLASRQKSRLARLVNAKKQPAGTGP